MTVVNTRAAVADLLGTVLDEAVVGTVPDEELFAGIEDRRVVQRLRELLAEGRIDRSTLHQASQLRQAAEVARTPRRKPSHVYFIVAEATGLIKIGSASNPDARLRSLQTGCPDRLTLVAAIAAGDGPAAERDLHRRFAADRVRGEWFYPSPGLLEFIESIGGGC